MCVFCETTLIKTTSVPDKNFQSSSSLFATMDLEETVKRLQSDLENSRELISYLRETVKTLKSGRDEDLHRKLDEILSQRAKQEGFEKKINSLREEFATSREEVRFLREEVKKVSEDIRNSEEMRHIKDSVETCVEYQELFVKHFEKIHLKMQEIKGEFSVKFDNLELKLQGGSRETGNIGNGLKDIESKIENFERNLDGIGKNEQKLVDFGEKIEKLERELKGKIDLMSKSLSETNDNLEMGVKTVIKESTKRNTAMDQKLVEMNEQVKDIPETNLKCWDPDCNSILPKNLPLREDGVSVKCPRCDEYNIVGKLKEEHKWMSMYCNEFHFQQFPVDKKHFDIEKCHVCGKEGDIYDANGLMAVPC